MAPHSSTLAWKIPWTGELVAGTAAASTSKSHICIGRERSVPAKKNKRETKDGVERIRPKWLMPSFIVLQYI